MKLSECSKEVMEKLKSYHWNKIVGTNEGSSPWGFALDYQNVELMDIEGHQVLLPMKKERFSRQTIQRCILSSDGQTLILSFQDLSFGDNWEPLFLAICDKFPGEDFFVTTTFYESSPDSDEPF